MIRFLLRLFRCDHLDSLREQRDGIWYWACPTCGRSAVLNPREKDAPKMTGVYNEQQAVAALAAAELHTKSRRKHEAQRSRPRPVDSKAEPGKVIEIARRGRP